MTGLVSDVLGLRNLSYALSELGPDARSLAYAASRCDEVGVTTRVREGVSGATGLSAALERWLPLLLLLFIILQLVLLPVPLDLQEEEREAVTSLHVLYWTQRIPEGSHLVSDRGTDGLIEELDADDRKETDPHRQDDGQPQVRLSQSVRRSTYGSKQQPSHTNSQCVLCLRLISEITVQNMPAYRQNLRF